jgi:hypothetical protein
MRRQAIKGMEKQTMKEMMKKLVMKLTKTLKLLKPSDNEKEEDESFIKCLGSVFL